MKYIYKYCCALYSCFNITYNRSKCFKFNEPYLSVAVDISFDLLLTIYKEGGSEVIVFVFDLSN